MNATVCSKLRANLFTMGAGTAALPVIIRCQMLQESYIFAGRPP